MKKLFKIEHMIMFALSMVGLIFRLYVINTLRNVPIYDFETYYEVARNIYNHLGFTLGGQPMAFQGMGYSTLLAVWFKLFNGTTEILAKQLNVLLSMASIYLLYYTLNRLLKNKTVIGIITGIFIFLPNNILYVNAIGSEVLSVFLFILVIAIYVSPIKWQFRYPVLGIAIGVLTLTKPFFLAYPLVIGMIHWLTTKDYKDVFKLVVITGLLMMMTMAPWTYRNYQKFDRFIPVSYNSGFNLYINNNANNWNGGWQSFDDIYKTPELQEKINEHLDNPLNSVKIASDIELDFKPAAQKWIRENPFEFFKLGVIRVHSTYFSGTWDLEDWTMNRHREDLHNTKESAYVNRQFNFMRSTFDLFIYTLSAFGLWFIILNFKSVVFGIFNKEKLNPYKIVTFMNLSFVSIVYFVYEGQPRYNFVVLFLLIMATVEIISTYIKAQKNVEEDL